MALIGDKVPEFISLMRTIRDVYYREMAKGLQIIREVTPAFARFSEQLQNPEAEANTLPEGSNATATVVLSDKAMQFIFGIPKGDKGDKGDQGDQGAGVFIKGADTYANIITKTDAVLGDCWICTDIPGINPPTGSPGINDGLTPRIDNPQDENDWINVGQVKGPQGDVGPQGPIGPEGPQGPEGERGSRVWFYQDVPEPPVEPGQKVGDMAVIEYSSIEYYDGMYFELIDVGTSVTWTQRGKFDGPTGPRGSYWYAGAGAPTDVPGSKDNDLYLDVNTNDIYQLQSGIWVVIGGIDKMTEWGFITGDIANQPDLASELDSKVINNDGYNAVNNITSLTQAEYDAIASPNPNTLYIIVE